MNLFVYTCIDSQQMFLFSIIFIPHYVTWNVLTSYIVLSIATFTSYYFLKEYLQEE